MKKIIIIAALMAIVIPELAVADAAHDLGNLIILRPGEADHTINRTFNTDPGHPSYRPSYLTDQGKKQLDTSAKRLGSTLDSRNITAIYAAPLPRTLQAAEKVAEKLGIRRGLIVIDARLNAISAGEREGRSYAESGDKDTWFASDPLSFGGETVPQVNARLQSFIDEIMVSAPLKQGNIIVVSSGPVEYLLSKQLTPDDKTDRLPLGEYSIIPIKNPAALVDTPSVEDGDPSPISSNNGKTAQQSHNDMPAPTS